jgi:molybdenum cofactor biosynthesis protein B
MTARELKPLRVAVLTVSDTRDETTDKSGALLVERLRSAGHTLAAKAIVRDDIYAIRAIVSGWIADSAVEVVLTTGGTGLTGRDGTPEAVVPLLDKEIGGFGELFRTISYDDIGPSSLQSRCVAGVAHATYI